MNKNKNIKEQELEIKATVPVALTNLQEVDAQLYKARETTDLLAPVRTISEVEKAIKNAKKLLKDNIESAKAELKQFEEIIKDRKASAIKTALELVEVTAKDTFTKTGELKVKITHNLPKGFAYTPEKVKTVIDFDTMVEAYKKNGERSKFAKYFEKQTTYVLNRDAVNEAVGNGKAKEIPFKTIKTEAKVVIKPADMEVENV